MKEMVDTAQPKHSNNHAKTESGFCSNISDFARIFMIITIGVTGQKISILTLDSIRGPQNYSPTSELELLMENLDRVEACFVLISLHIRSM